MQNQSKPGGTLTSGDREVVVRTRLSGPRRPRRSPTYPIASMDGRTVYLRDVAEVVNTHAEQRSAYRSDGKEAIEVAVFQHPDASSVRVIAGVKAKLDEIEEDFPASSSTSPTTTPLRRHPLRQHVRGAGDGDPAHRHRRAPLPGEWRGTLITLITIPISLAMAMLAMCRWG